MITGTGFLTIIQPLASKPPLFLLLFLRPGPDYKQFSVNVNDSPRYAFLPTFTPLPIFDQCQS
jgi:hypothetical protein